MEKTQIKKIEFFEIHAFNWKIVNKQQYSSQKIFDVKHSFDILMIN